MLLYQWDNWTSAIHALNNSSQYCDWPFCAFDPQEALSAMTGVAHHINEMKRQHEVAVHVQVERDSSIFHMIL